jgi:cellulose biosynthesis protein BcsQ
MIRFDQALEIALGTASRLCGSLPSDLHVVRDVVGRISLIWPQSTQLSAQSLAALRTELHKQLGKWSSGPSQVLMPAEDIFELADVVESPDRRAIEASDINAARLPAEFRVFLVDRLITNQEWLREPLPEIASVKIATAFSIKGGVGRSTAFAILAWHLARQGKRVAVVDLDLEAPGIASLLLSDLPALGVTDWMVESFGGDTDPTVLADCIAPWTLSADLAGSVEVLPAFGSKTNAYIDKLGRVFGSSLMQDGSVEGFSERLHRLLVSLAATSRYDVILLDSRAGLHDIGAAAVTRLGSEVFLFGRDEVQSWLAYRHLLRHLRHSHCVSWNQTANDSDLRWRLKMVAAQVAPEESARSAFIDRSYECWLDLYDEEAETSGDSDGQEQGFNLFTFSEDDAAAPHYPLVVPFDPRARGYDLRSRETLVSWDLVWSTFGVFLESATSRLFPSTEGA